MITSMSIENFKGIQDRVKLDFRPITLLFGANSAGKSTLFHSLLLAYELLARGNRNPDKTAFGGNLVDLGGFLNFVHQHDLSKSVRLRFELDLGSVAFDREWPLAEKLINLRGSELDASTIGDDIFEASVEIDLSWDWHEHVPFVSRYAVELDGQPFATMTDDRKSRLFSGSTPELRVARRHPVWELPSGMEDLVGLLDLLVPGFPTQTERMFHEAETFSVFDLQRLIDECGEVQETSFLPHAAAAMEDFLFDDAEQAFYDDYVDDDGPNAEDVAWTGPVKTCPEIDRLLARQDVSIGVFQTTDFEGYGFRAFLYRTADGAVGCAAGQFENDDDECIVDMARWCSENRITWGLASRTDFVAKLKSTDALPNFHRLLDFELTLDEHDTESLGDSREGMADLHFLRGILSRLILVPGRALAETLGRLRYLGPLRETVSRNYAAPRTPEPSRWACGLGAWDRLDSGSDQFLDEVSRWLGDEDKLNAGCSIERRRSVIFDAMDPIIRKMISGNAFDDVEPDWKLDPSSISYVHRVVIVGNSGIELHPHEVGIGISQIVPVIVAALDGEHGMLTIEQPELHVHPRLQAAMGDLFIEAIATKNHRFIIETHSEHLILRLLRRIRETEAGKAPENRQLRTDDLGIYYLKQEGGTTRESRIDVDVKGEFIQPWPDDFFEIDFFERFPDAR